VGKRRNHIEQKSCDRFQNNVKQGAIHNVEDNIFYGQANDDMKT
jgi:hypothetical protein